MRDRVLAWLADNVPPPRLRHILGVEAMAVELAEAHGLDAEKAAQAGLLHDLAKYFKPQQLLGMAREEGLEIDSILEANPHLLHADVSAIVARDQFDVRDLEVLQAIRNHTLGQPAMSLLCCAVFVADSLEPSRGDTAELNAMRQVSRQNLYQAVWRTSDYSLGFLLETRQMIHPRTILTRNWALQLSALERQTVKTLETPCISA